MNLANKLTFSRILMVPVFMVVLLGNWIAEPQRSYIALVIFAIASLTDLLDGHIARSRNMVTKLGKFMDPLADKLLVTAAFISLVELGRLQAWVAILIISRELIITGFRTVAASEGIVIAASWWGKIKTNIQIFMIILLLLHIPGSIFGMLETVMIWLAVIFTVMSGVDYIAKNKKVLGIGENL
jgi:CDP-diacylglycerol--glycerol-3-phosphate 3-phosphatidyltransferase